MAQNTVVFRRIGGRVVPIRSDRGGKATGAATVAGGLAVGAAAGRVAGSLEEGAAHAHNAARTAAKAARAKHAKTAATGPLFRLKADRELASDAGKIFQSMAKSRKLFDTAQKVKKAGPAASAVLVAAGTHQALKDKDPKTQAAVATGAGVTAHFAVRSAYLNRVGTKGFQGLKSAAKYALKRGRIR